MKHFMWLDLKYIPMELVIKSKITIAIAHANTPQSFSLLENVVRISFHLPTLSKSILFWLSMLHQLTVSW